VLVSERDSSVSAREALLVWSRRMVAGYPGVRINDFTHSWRDGLAFLAILHRNRYQTDTHGQTNKPVL